MTDALSSRPLGDGLYAREPLSHREGIPVFSREDAYTTNYEQISGDHLAAVRDSGRNPFIDEAVWRAAEESTLTLIRKYSRPGDAILDVGVGLGRLLDGCPELRRHGIDISFSYLREARAKGIDVCYARIEDMPYHEGVFDVVVCTDVLEHVLDLNLALDRIVRVLRPGGVLIVRVPYREDLRYYASDDCPYEYVHLRNFDEYSLRLLLEKAFPLETREVVKAAYAAVPSRLRYRLPLPRWDAVLGYSLAAVRRVAPRRHDTWVRRLFEPIEINIVASKTGGSPGPTGAVEPRGVH